MKEPTIDRQRTVVIVEPPLRGWAITDAWPCVRNTLAIDHHHPVCPLTFLGFSNRTAPFFALTSWASSTNLTWSVLTTTSVPHNSVHRRSALTMSMVVKFPVSSFWKAMLFASVPIWLRPHGDLRSSIPLHARPAK